MIERVEFERTIRISSTSPTYSITIPKALIDAGVLRHGKRYKIIIEEIKRGVSQ